MNLQLIIAAVIAAASFGGGWQIQSWRCQAKEKDRAEQILDDERLAAKRAIRQIDAVSAAQSAAANRSGSLRRDADGVRTALVSLHDAAEQALRAARADHEACIERTVVATDALKAVAKAGGELAARADRIDNDRMMLLEAWPE